MTLRIFTICMLINLALSAQRRGPLDISIDWESYDPPSTLVVPENHTTNAKFPLLSTTQSLHLAIY